MQNSETFKIEASECRGLWVLNFPKSVRADFNFSQKLELKKFKFGFRISIFLKKLNSKTSNADFDFQKLELKKFKFGVWIPIGKTKIKNTKMRNRDFDFSQKLELKKPKMRIWDFNFSQKLELKNFKMRILDFDFSKKLELIFINNLILK